MALVVFLRGVNVGGYRSFRPSALAQQLKHYDAINIGAAGTFVIRRRVSVADLRAELQRRLPFQTEVMICTSRDILAVAASDPFKGKPIHAGVVRFVSILGRRPGVSPSLPLCLPNDHEWLVQILSRKNRFIFGMYRRQMQTLRYLSRIDSLFRVPVTTRNWNTFTAIVMALNKTGSRSG